jgi:asparagine synthase (glutamine-hydrolysing)
MCGIAGLWRFGGGAVDDLTAQARAMTDTLAKRGPDGDGHWVDGEVGIALGHRRLAIIDLTPTGLQPMASADGRVVITYNGELYNRSEMAAELAMSFRGTSDTEVLVEAIARFGIDGALARANGLFAFAAFDRAARTLHLARDRLGIKPLYFTRQGGLLAFASELKAMRTLDGLEFSLDLESVGSYLRHACVPAPRAIYRDVEKLLPGHRIEVTAAGVRRHCYWDLAAVARAGQSKLDRRCEREIVDELHALLADAVKAQMVSDVALGAFLSGGVDSSLVVALMQRASTRPIKTFSIGFREDAFNEAEHAKRVAHHLGTDHTELVLSAEQARALIPQLPQVYDEPFADSSQLPTYLVSSLARQNVTVALSGDGGDEVFGGYVRHQSVPRLHNALRHVPRSARKLAAGALELLSPSAWDMIGSIVPKRLRPTHFGDKVLKGARILSAADGLATYRQLVTQWPDSDLLLPKVVEPPGWADQAADAMPHLDMTSQLRLLDMMGYLPDDILTKVDRASMAVSLEARVPLLDHRLVEFSWRLPSAVLINQGQGKRPLRSVLSRYVPQALVDRPKMGFGVPIGEWLRGPLRSWAEDLLSKAALSDGLFDASLVQRRLSEHLSGRRNWQHALWTLLQFQAWRRANA